MKPKLYTQKEVEWQKKHLPALLDAGIIDWVNSPWSASCKFPVKKNGDLRMVHIYCPINDATIKTNYPVKRTEPIINAMSMSRFKIYWWADGANGYWAIPMYRPHAFKTAFSSVLGQFVYLRMGQGLTGAPHTYAQLKDLVMGPIPEPMGERPLSGETEDFAFMTFFDDDMGANTSFETQLGFLHDHYFPRMHWAKMVLNPAKSHFFMPRIEMLGLQADGRGVRPGNDKLGKFKEYPTPTCEKELDQFEYMTTYLRKFIPGRAEHFRIMRKAVVKVPELSHGKVPELDGTKKAKVRLREIGFNWTEEAEQSFRIVKKSVLDNACHGGDPARQYHLACDASGFAYGGVLFLLADQPMGTVMSSKLIGSMRIVQFISKKFLDAETRYHTTEREALAIVRCLEETRWLVNENRHPVLIYTDHECLKMALQNSDKGRIVGWQLRLSEYDFRIIHIKGKENALADGMSRIPVEVMDFGRPGKEDSALEIMSAGATEAELGGEAEKRWGYWLMDEWYAGVVYLKLYGKLREKDVGEESLTVWRWWIRKAAAYQLMDEPDDYPLLAYTERTGKQSWCVRKSEVDKVLEWAHDCHGHYAWDLTLKRLIGHYYWPTRAKDTHRFCRSCRSCQLTGRKRPSQVPRPIVQLRPMDMIGIDGLGPISPVSGDFKYILIVVDYFTRYAWARALPAITGSAVSEFIDSIAKTFGLPNGVYTDNATYFVSGVFPDFLATRGVRQFPAPKTHPASVGLLERYVQLVLYGIRKIVVGGGEIQRWSAYLDQVIHSMNTREVRVHGYSPAELLLGYSPNIHHHEFTVRDRQAARDLQERQQIWNQQDDPDFLGAQREVRLATHDEVIESTQQRYLTRFVSQQSKTGRFPAPKEGDLVLLLRAALDNRYNKKLDARWGGPFRLGNIAHHGRSGRLYDLITGQLVKTKQAGLKDRVHLDDLRVYVSRDQSQEEEITTIERVECDKDD